MLGASRSDKRGVGPAPPPFGGVCSVTEAPSTTIWTGRVSERYRVDDILSVDPEETLVRALDQTGLRRVAIRFLTGARHASSERRARWRSEACASRSVHSPHFAEVLDVDETDAEVPYVVSEYVGGCPLDLMTASGTVSGESAVGWVNQACQGLTAAHLQGLVHHALTPRSLKVVRSETGRVVARLLGLGASHLLDSSPRPLAPATGPSYRAPELVRRDLRESVASNVWSLGVILYELLTGVLPFRGGCIDDVERWVTSEAPPPPSRLRPDIPKPLESVVLGCLTKRPEERIASAAALSRELRPFAGPCRHTAPRLASAARQAPAHCTAAPALRNRRRPIVLL